MVAMIKRFEHFSTMIADIYRLWQKIAAIEMAKHGLKGMHAVYLTMLLRYNEGLTLTQICDKCGRDKAEVSRLVNMLSEKEMIEKSNATGKYKSKILLTAKGKEAAEDVAKKAELAVEKASQDVEPQEREIFYRVLESIHYNLLNVCEKGLE